MPTEKGNIITYSDTTTSEGIFYQPVDFVGYSHIQGLYPISFNSKWNYKTLLYIVILFKKSAAGKFNYGNKFNRKIASELKIALPTKNKEIDFEFMENFVAELEAQRVAELEAYLCVTGLKNYELTEEEKNILSQLDAVKWQEYKISDLFEKINTKNLKVKVSELSNKKTEEFSLPVLTAGIENQGLNNYIQRNNATILKNVISISANGANTGATFFQSTEFTVLQDAYAIKYKNKKCIKNNQYLFLVGAIRKVIYGNFSWSNKAGWEKVKRECIQLPTKNGEIDFEFMETSIKAIQKLVIKDVVCFADKKIAGTRKVIKNK